jgi:hypothetical protein
MNCRSSNWLPSQQREKPILGSPEQGRHCWGWCCCQQPALLLLLKLQALEPLLLALLLSLLLVLVLVLLLPLVVVGPAAAWQILEAPVLRQPGHPPASAAGPWQQSP